MTIAVKTPRNGDAASDTTAAQIGDTIAAGLSRPTSTVAGYLVTLTVQTRIAIVQSLARVIWDLFDGFAAEAKTVIGLTPDDDRAGVCLGDPTAYV